MATPKRSKDTCSYLIHESPLETQTAVCLGGMAHNKPKSSHRMRPLRRESIKSPSTELKSLNLNGHDDGDQIEQLPDDLEATYARCPTRTVVHNPKANDSECSSQSSHPETNHTACTQYKSDRMVNGCAVFQDGDTTLPNGDGHKDGFLRRHGVHFGWKSHRHEGHGEGRRPSIDLCDGGKEEEEECVGEDEPDGIISDLMVHTKHFVRSFFGRTFFRCHRERSVDSNDDTDRNVTNNVLVPSPFQNGYECLGVHIRREEIGLRVTRVFNDSLACKAHLKESDILTHLDDKELTNRELGEIRGMFEGVKKTFKLTVWREVHEENKVRRTQLTIQISITETVDRSFEIEVSVSRVRFNALQPSTQCHFITQDPDGSHQIYLHYDEDGSLSMGDIADDDQVCRARAAFYFDFYYCLPLSRNTPIYRGQLCTIRHRTRAGDKIFNCNTGRMESVPAGRTRPRDMQRYFIDRVLTNEQYKFRVFLPNGNHDRYLTNVDGKIQLCTTDQVQSYDLFKVYNV